MTNIDQGAIIASQNSEMLSDFIESNKKFIIGCAFKTTGKYITMNDDEWSISLIAFSDAVSSYSLSSGSFHSYAETIIRNRLIDYYRSEKRHNSECPVNPSIFETDSDDDEEDISMKIAVSEKLAYHIDNDIKYEIEAVTEEFKKYEFSFFDLAECSPKSQKTKEACRQVVLYILDNKEIINEIKNSRQLPIKILQKNTDLPRKILERHRKYIIAAMEILSGEYPCLAEYVSYIRKDGR